MVVHGVLERIKQKMALIANDLEVPWSHPGRLRRVAFKALFRGGGDVSPWDSGTL